MHFLITANLKQNDIIENMARLSCLSGVCIVLFIFISVVKETEPRQLLFFLVDGFRWDYFNIPGLQLKGFTRLFERGTRAEWLTPDFPTNSLPNYKTLETGLHVENHGFVGNYMYDEQSGKEFKLTLENPESLHPDWWNKAESFFITAEKQGIKTALYQVRGCQINHDGITPTYCFPYRDYPTFEETEWAINDGLSKMKKNLVDIVYIFHQEVDRMGHSYGPNSQEVKQAVLTVDGHVDRMLDTIERNKQMNIDIIIVSDHGMASIDQLHMINITEVLEMKNIKKITDDRTQAFIWPVPGKEKVVYNQLKTFHRHLRVYLRDDLMDRWFFKNHSLIPPIYLNTDKGWFIVHPKSSEIYPENGPWQGNHGFDNDDHDMRAIFIAYGPDFKAKFTAKPFSNINVYQLICHITGIHAKPNNGTWSEVKDMLVSDEKHTEL